MTAVTPRMDLLRFEVADWGEECVVYDKYEFLTHLLPAHASHFLRDRLRSLGDGPLVESGPRVDVDDVDAASLLHSIGILSAPNAWVAVEPPARLGKGSVSKSLPQDEPAG